MTPDVRFLLSLSILIPVIISILRFKKLPVKYYPVIAIVFVGLLNESIVYLFFQKKNAVPNNIYSLLEFLFWCLQFRYWENILDNKKSFFFLTGAAMLIWIIDEVILMKIITYKSLLLIFFPFILVLMATRQLSLIIAIGKGSILKNPIFIFCIGIVIFYSYRVLSEIFYHYAPTTAMQRSIFSIQVYMNIIFNIILGIGIFMIPKKGTLTN